MELPANHEEAEQLAKMKRDEWKLDSCYLETNLACCYLDMKLQNQDLQKQLDNLSQEHDEDCRVQKVLIHQRDRAEKELMEKDRLNGEMVKLLEECKGWLSHQYACPESPDAFSENLIKFIEKVNPYIEKRSGLGPNEETCDKCGTPKARGYMCGVCFGPKRIGPGDNYLG